MVDVDIDVLFNEYDEAVVRTMQANQSSGYAVVIEKTIATEAAATSLAAGGATTTIATVAAATAVATATATATINETTSAVTATRVVKSII